MVLKLSSFGPLTKLIIELLLFSSICPASKAQKSAVSEKSRHYIVVIDAGSTGSRVHVYPYIQSEPLPTFFPDEEFTVKKKPGLSSFQENPADAGDSLGAILQEARDHIPSTIQLSVVPVFLAATAGLRKVEAVDPDASQRIMLSVRTALRSSGFKFKDNWAKIITGVDEGCFGWVTVNYLLGNFDNEEAKTTGVLEMGGESIQLTFLPQTPHPDGLAQELITPMKVAERTYNLFAHSWMGYGMEAAQAKFDDFLVDEDATPCYLTGDVRKSTGADSTRTYKGEGNFLACYLLLKESLRDAKGDCEVQDGLRCSLDGLQIPKDMGDMVLIENFWYTANVAGFTEEEMQGQAYYDRMQEFGKEYCAMTLKDGPKILGKKTADDGEIHKECFCSAYVNAMIKEGVGFTSSNNYKVVRNIENADLDWALGYAVVQEATGVARSNGRYWWYIFGAILILIVAGAVYWKLRTKRSFPRYGVVSQRDPGDSWAFSRRKPKARESPDANEKASGFGASNLVK